MLYRILILLLLVSTVTIGQNSLPTAYVAKRDNMVYWAISPFTSDSTLLQINNALRSYGIGFKPHVERDEQGLIIRFWGNIIAYDKARVQPSDQLLMSRLIPLEEREQWPVAINIDLGNTGFKLILPPVGFWYDPKTGLHSDMITDNFPASIRQQIEQECPEKIADSLLAENKRRKLNFKNTIQIGSPAPEFTLPDTAGRSVQLADYRGKIVYLDFWAHWCGPCMVDMEHLKEVKKHFQQRQDLTFLSVSIDEMKDHPKWLATIRKHQFVGTHVISDKGKNSNVMQSYGINAVPTTFIIDRKGNFYSVSPKAPHHSKGELLIQELEKALAHK